MDELEPIERDRFVYFFALQRTLHDPQPWPRFRDRLLEALTAVFALDAVAVGQPEAAARLVQGRRRAAQRLLDGVRAHIDPAQDWPGFVEAVWAGRQRLLDDAADHPSATS